MTLPKIMPLTPRNRRYYRTPPSSKRRRKKLVQTSPRRLLSTSSSSNPLYDYSTTTSSSNIPSSPTYREYASGNYRRNRPTSWQRAGVRTLAVASGAQLGFIQGNVPGAVAGGVLAGRAYDATHQDEGFESLTRVEQSFTKKYNMPGKYVGSFRKPKKYGMSNDDYFLKKGFLAGYETFGKVTDSHCVYVQHSTYDVPQLHLTIVTAMLRKALAKCGLAIVDRNGVLPLQGPGNALGYRFEYASLDPTTQVALVSAYETSAGDSLRSIVAGWNNVNNPSSEIETFLKNQHPRMPHYLAIYALTTGSAHRLLTMLHLNNEVLDIQWMSQIVVQNRTVGDTATATDLNIERLDNQPLVGTIFEFNSEPKLKFHDTSVATEVGQHFQNTSPTGLKLFGSQSFTLPAGFVDNFQNSPSPSIWSNCIKKTKVVLQPGDMKTSTLHHTMKGKMNILLPKLRLEQATGTNVLTGLVGGVKTKTQLLVLEEKMRTAGSNPITLHYERKITCGVVLTTKKQNLAIFPSFVTFPTNFPAV